MHLRTLRNVMIWIATALLSGCDQPVDSMIPASTSTNENGTSDGNENAAGDMTGSADTNENVSNEDDSDTGDGMNENSLEESDSTEESMDQAPDADALASDAIKAAGMAIASALPVTDIPDLLLGIKPQPACPDTSVESEFDAFNVGLDYGTGCATATYPNLTAAGTVDGTLFAANAISVELLDTSWQGVESAGMVSGSFVFNTSGLNLAVTVHIVHYGINVDGQLQVAVDRETADMYVNAGSLTLFGDHMPVYELTIEDAHMEPNVQHSFDPTTVDATLTWLTDAGETQETAVRFGQ